MTRPNKRRNRAYPLAPRASSSSHSVIGAECYIKPTTSQPGKPKKCERLLPRVDPLTSTLNPVSTMGDGSPTTPDRLAVLEMVPIEVEVQRFGFGTSATIVITHSTLVGGGIPKMQTDLTQKRTVLRARCW